LVPHAVSGLVITGVVAIVNVFVFDVPPHGVTTVIEAVPAVVMRAAGTVAVNCVEEPNVVTRAVPFQFTVDPETKFVPFTVSVNPEPPAVAQVGLSELIVGAALIVNVCAVDVDPAQGFATVIDAVPAVAIREAGTVAVNCVEEPNVVLSGVPFQFTVAPLTKLVPFTVKVNCAPPAVAQVGLSELIVGLALMVITSVC
jgi:xanthosine utilization system XapX-like protein